MFQSPPDLLLQLHDAAKLTLTHKIQSYDTILWYQRSAGDPSLTLIGYMSYQNPKIEGGFVGRFEVSGDGENTAHLHILNLTDGEYGGEYFGAAGRHSGEDGGALLQKPPH